MAEKYRVCQTAQGQISALKRLVKRYRRLADRLIAEGHTYTDGMDCVFCSGQDDYRSSEDRDGGEVKHSRRCPTRKAAELEKVYFAVVLGISKEEP